MSRMGRLKDDSGVGSCLTAIRQAQDRIHLLNGMRASPTVLASQIELCDVLLVEISDIRSSLVRDLRASRNSHSGTVHLGR